MPEWMKDAVDRALAEVVLLAERRVPQRLTSMADVDLDDDHIMAGAWR